MAVALGDLDGDATLDAVAVNSGSRDVTILLGDGSGSFVDPELVSMGADPRSVATEISMGMGTSIWPWQTAAQGACPSSWVTASEESVREAT